MSDNLSQTEECMIRCFRKVCSVAMSAWFWTWTSGLIYANELRKILYTQPDTDLNSPVSEVLIDQSGIRLIGTDAEDLVIGATAIQSDGTEKIIDEMFLYERTTSTTAGDLLSHCGFSSDRETTLSLILASGPMLKFGWDDE